VPVLLYYHLSSPNSVPELFRMLNFIFVLGLRRRERAEGFFRRLGDERSMRWRSRGITSSGSAARSTPARAPYHSDAASGGWPSATRANKRTLRWAPLPRAKAACSSAAHHNALPAPAARYALPRWRTPPAHFCGDRAVNAAAAGARRCCAAGAFRRAYLPPAAQRACAPAQGGATRRGRRGAGNAAQSAALKLPAAGGVPQLRGTPACR